VLAATNSVDGNKRSLLKLLQYIDKHVAYMLGCFTYNSVFSSRHIRRLSPQRAWMGM